MMLTARELEDFAVTAYLVWKQRNCLVFKGYIQKLKKK